MAYTISGIKPNVGRLRLYSKAVDPTWVTHDFDLFKVNSVAYGNGLFVAVGEGIATSPDGLTWTNRNITPQYPLNRVIYANGKFTAIGNLGVLYNSTTGTSWTNNKFTSSNTINSITFANGYYIATIDGGSIIYSSNGVSWTGKYINSSDTYITSSYIGGRFVVGGVVGRTATATIPTNTWSRSYIGSTNTVTSFAQNGSILLALPNVTLKYASTTNGINWTQLDAPITAISLMSANTKFFMTNSSSVYSSDDGLTWKQNISDASTYFNEVCYGNGKYLACSSNANLIFTMVPPE